MYMYMCMMCVYIYIYIYICIPTAPLVPSGAEPPASEAAAETPLQPLIWCSES